MPNTVKPLTWIAGTLAFVLSLAFSCPAYSQTSNESAVSRLAQEFDLASRLNWNYKPPGPSISLYRWMVYQMNKTEEARRQQPPIPKYDRIWHFGGWVNEDSPRDCFDTRQEVLIRSANSNSPIIFQPTNKCKVLNGLWLDPYTGKSTDAAATMDIDHVVALGHAYENGGHRWPPAVRCHYANFLSNGFHLLAVSAHENRSKSAKDPIGYIPPYRPFVCTYLNMWLKIKLVWDLEISRPEAERIADVYKRANCDMRAAVMGQRDMMDQQKYASQPSLACVRKMNGRVNGPAPQQFTRMMELQ